MLIPTLCRSKHFIRLVESLKRNTWAKYTDVYVGLDYPPSEKYRQGWQEICDYVDNGDFSCFAKFVVFKRTENYGSARNSSHLIEYAYEHYPCWIRTDDDVEFSPNFLEFEDKCLWAYRNDPDVTCVSGYSYPVKWKMDEGITCFKQNFTLSAWGLGFWGSKKSEYSDYIKTGKMLADAGNVVKKKYHERMIDSCFRDYFSSVLSYGSQTSLFLICSDIALRAYLACHTKYCISPVISKVRNHGFDGTGEYCTAIEGNGEHALDFNYSTQEIDTSDHFDFIPDDSLQYTEENKRALNAFDYRSEEEMKPAIHNFQLIKRYGLTIAKIIHGVETFFENKLHLGKK